AADFGKDRERVRVPLDHHLPEMDLITIADLHFRAVNHGVAFTLAVLIIDDRDRALAVHHDKVARLRLHCLQADEVHRAVRLGIETRLLGNSRCRTADVEGTHRELRSRLADRLSSDDARGFTQFDQTARSQVATVAHDANATL